MSNDFFDDLVSPAEDFSEANAAVAGGSLLVPERAPTGQFLNIEAEAFRAAGALAYLALFVEADEITGEAILSNAREIADAAGMVSLPDEQEAFDWLNWRLGEAFEPWRPRLAAAWAEAEANSPAPAKPKPEDAPLVWKRPPHSTGTSRGQKR